MKFNIKNPKVFARILVAATLFFISISGVLESNLAIIFLIMSIWYGLKAWGEVGVDVKTFPS